VPVSAFKAAPFELAWGSEVWARVKAWNYYGNYGFSASGNGAVITTYPDAPTTLVERYADRDTYVLGLTWADAAFNGGAVIEDYRIWIAVSG
jgi:hypothetical protein